MTIQAQSTIQLDNERTRVTEWRFPPAAETGYHQHEYDFLVVPLTSGKLKIVGPDGNQRIKQISTGKSYSRKAGTEHNVINMSDYELVLLEIELMK